jgi:hypothetical protein
VTDIILIIQRFMAMLAIERYVLARRIDYFVSAPFAQIPTLSASGMRVLNHQIAMSAAYFHRLSLAIPPIAHDAPL